jgi:hypothetical protein
VKCSRRRRRRGEAGTVTDGDRDKAKSGDFAYMAPNSPFESPADRSSHENGRVTSRESVPFSCSADHVRDFGLNVLDDKRL